MQPVNLVDWNTVLKKNHLFIFIKRSMTVKINLVIIPNLPVGHMREYGRAKNKSKHIQALR